MSPRSRGVKSGVIVFELHAESIGADGVWELLIIRVHHGCIRGTSPDWRHCMIASSSLIMPGKGIPVGKDI